MLLTFLLSAIIEEIYPFKSEVEHRVLNFLKIDNISVLEFI